MTPERPVVLALLPVGQTVDLHVALGDLIDAALGGGSMLAPGQHPEVAAELRLPDGADPREAADRLRHAAATVRGVEYVPAPRDPDEPDLTIGQIRELPGGGIDLGLGGPRDLHELAAVNLVGAFKPVLDEQGAPNYVEFEVLAPDVSTDGVGVQGGGQRYVVIVARPGGKTPHQLRRDAETEAAQLRARLDAQRAAARAVYGRAGTLLGDDDTLDAELLETANKAGGSLLRYLRGEEGAIPFSALSDLLKAVAALREVLGYRPGTPVPRELIAAERAAMVERPEHCPECREIGLCLPRCKVAALHGWPREIEIEEATSHA